MALKPSVYPQWASEDVQDTVSQQWNVVIPPLEKRQIGWSLGEKGPRQWFNWLFRTTYDWIVWFDQQTAGSTTTDTGIGLFPVNNALIEISAVDLDDPTSVYKATGIKVAGQPPQFAPASVVSNNLSLGAGTISGTQPILGGTNVIVTSSYRVIPS